MREALHGTTRPPIPDGPSGSFENPSVNVALESVHDPTGKTADAAEQVAAYRRWRVVAGWVLIEVCEAGKASKQPGAEYLAELIAELRLGRGQPGFWTKTARLKVQSPLPLLLITRIELLLALPRSGR